MVFAIVGLLVGGLLGLLAWRESDRRNDRLVWTLLSEANDHGDDNFNPTVIEDLPEPARRYFQFTIQPGTPLRRAAEIDMRGELGLGSKEEPKYSRMRARQILAPPHGLVWRLRTGAISGSDGATPDTSWTRFWLFGLIPVVRVGGDGNHHRSAFGRVVAEGAFWAPATLLPSENVRWEKVDADTARATIRFGDQEQAVDVTVAACGQPTRVVIQRWSDANPDKKYRLQPFGGYLSDFRDIGGYRLPTRVEGGNLIGSDEYFPFYKAEVTSLRWIGEA